MWKSLHAKWVLAWALVKHVVLSWTPLIRRSTPKTWLARLAEESLAPTPAHAWEYVEGTSRCIGCGLCDIHGAAGQDLSGWIRAVARRPQDADLAQVHTQELRDKAEKIARICPSGVSVAGIVRLIEEQRAALNGPS